MFKKYKYMFVIFVVLFFLLYLRLKSVEVNVQTFHAYNDSSVEATTEMILEASEVNTTKPNSEASVQTMQEHRLVYSAELDQTYTLEAFNQLDLEVLMSFKGIGLVTAEAILNDRKLNGPLSNFDDLMRVKGIGEKKLANILYELP